MSPARNLRYHSQLKQGLRCLLIYLPHLVYKLPQLMNSHLQMFLFRLMLSRPRWYNCLHLNLLLYLRVDYLNR